MNQRDANIDAEVRAFCARIGADPLLVQGAGGNVSWKDSTILWVKASGTWLAAAERADLFVGVDLERLKRAISAQEFTAVPVVTANAALRPSIETLLHALMPHRVVVHLHAVEMLAHLVRADALARVAQHVGRNADWVFVDYFKPGTDLAMAVSRALADRPDANVVFLRNHGVVIGAPSVREAAALLARLVSLMRTEPVPTQSQTDALRGPGILEIKGFRPLADPELHQLAMREEFAGRLEHCWALYPDHVVFLGPHAWILRSPFRAEGLDPDPGKRPPYLFAIGAGVLESESATPAQKAQLRCYYDVLRRLDSSAPLTALNSSQVGELLDWDAEKYRQHKGM